VDGVEISPQLARTAQSNIQKLKISRSTIFCGDAADFTDLDSYTYLYMYNPFPEAVTLRVLENIRSSLRRRTRRLNLIYKNAVFNDLVLNAGFRWLGDTRQTHPDYPPFSLYAADGPSPNIPHEQSVCE
jgi:hypothetical protein